MLGSSQILHCVILGVIQAVALLSHEGCSVCHMKQDPPGKGAKARTAVVSDPHQPRSRTSSTSVSSSRTGISNRRWKNNIKAPHQNATPVVLERASENIKSSDPDEATAQNRDPMAALQARPPSSRKTGNMFKADDSKPTKPTTKRGCNGIG